MNELVQCDFKLPRYFTGQLTARVLKLEMIDPALPNPALVWGSEIFLQFPQTGFPPGANGDITASIDPESRYVNSSAWPNVELAYQPMINYLKMIGKLQPILGTRGQSLRLPQPFKYRSGDSLIWAPELSTPLSGSPPVPTPYEVWPYWGVLYEREGNIPVGTTVFSIDLPDENFGSGLYSIRNVVPNLPVGGRKIRFHLLAAPNHATTLYHAFVGVRDGNTGNTVDVPVEAKILGQSGYNFTFGDSQDGVWTDWTDFPTVIGQSLLVGGDVSGAWAYKASSSYGNYNSTTASFNAKTMVAPTFQTDRSHLVDKIAIF